MAASLLVMLRKLMMTRREADSLVMESRVEVVVVNEGLSTYT